METKYLTTQAGGPNLETGSKKFARLLKEGCLQEFDLDGINENRIEKIKYLARGI